MVDLHMHSRYSDDGEFTPEELVRQCAAQGINVMSITDHNCAKANKEAVLLAPEYGIHYIPGIEIDCVYQEINFHVLGYGINHESSDFEQIESNVDRQNAEASLCMLAKTKELGFPVTEAEMKALAKNQYKQNAWTGEMFAEVLLAKSELKEHPLLLPYRPGGARSDNPYVNFYWDYYSQGKPCHVAIEYPSMERIIHMIHQNGGRAVLAHPGVNLKDREYLLEGILSLGMDGIEAFSSYHSKEQAAYYYEKAMEHLLIATCGSDFHGKTKPAICLGGVKLGLRTLE